MQPILANYSASITELKKSPTQLLNEADNEVIAILNHNIPSAYLVPSKLYEKMMDIIDDYHLSLEVEKEWSKLGSTIKEQFKKKLEERLENPKVEKDKLSGYENVYKIKLRILGYRLAYQVKDEEIVVLVLSVGKREKEKIYKNLKDRF